MFLSNQSIIEFQFMFSNFENIKTNQEFTQNDKKGCFVEFEEVFFFFLRIRKREKRKKEKEKKRKREKEKKRKREKEKKNIHGSQHERNAFRVRGGSCFH